MTASEINKLANHIVGCLHQLAGAIDSDYADECADSDCTNDDRPDSNSKVVRHLVHTASLVNASGLCDLREEYGCVACLLRKSPLLHRWYI